MLTFVLQDGSEVSWHVGEKKPKVSKNPDELIKFQNLIRDNIPFIDERVTAKRWIEDNFTSEFKVKSVHADGHELDYIKSNFTNLPIVLHRRIVVWTGDLAQFIYDNLI